MAATPVVSDQDLVNLLAGAFSSGGVHAQVPHEVWWLGPRSGMDKAAAQQLADQRALALERGLNDGVIAWQVANPTRHTGKVIYTPEARNPATGRLVSAYAWMTPLAIVRHGPELYQAYVRAVAEREKVFPGRLAPVPEPQFQQELLRQTVPVSPALASQVPAHILALASPPPATKIKPRLAADGFIDTLGRRQAHSLRHERLLDRALLEQLEKWKVGPATRLPDSPNSQEEIIQAVVSRAGPQGVDWLVDRNFPLDTSTYQLALLGAAPTTTLDALEKAGADPAATTCDGNFWNFIAATRNWDEDTVAWARKRNISFNEVDAQGDLPLATLLHKISHEAGVTDFFSSANGSMAAMILAMADPGGQAGKRFEFLEDLALEMVRSGVDLMHKNKQGLATAGNMFPEQASAQRRLFDLTDPGLPTARREQEAMQEMMFGDHEKLRRDPLAYGPRALAFIRKLEQVSGYALLDGPAPSRIRAPRP